MEEFTVTEKTGKDGVKIVVVGGSNMVENLVGSEIADKVKLVSVNTDAQALNYKDSVLNGADIGDLAHVKGYCVTIEQILSAYGGVTSEEIMKIKRPIIGDVSLRRGKKKNTNIDFDVPSIFRKQFRE